MYDFQRTSFKSSIQNLAQSYFNFSSLPGLRKNFQFHNPLQGFYLMIQRFMDDILLEMVIENHHNYNVNHLKTSWKEKEVTKSLRLFNT